MEKLKEGEKLGNEQVYDLITSKEVSWQTIIYDLINTEQLEPWDVDLSLLLNPSCYLSSI